MLPTQRTRGPEYYRGLLRAWLAKALWSASSLLVIFGGLTYVLGPPTVLSLAVVGEPASQPGAHLPLAALPGMGGPALGAAVGNGEAAFDFTVTGPSGPATAAVVSAQCPRAGRPSSVGVAASRADHPDAAPPGRLRLAVAMVGPRCRLGVRAEFAGRWFAGSRLFRPIPGQVYLVSAVLKQGAPLFGLPVPSY